MAVTTDPQTPVEEGRELDRAVAEEFYGVTIDESMEPGWTEFADGEHRAHPTAVDAYSSDPTSALYLFKHLRDRGHQLSLTRYEGQWTVLRWEGDYNEIYQQADDPSEVIARAALRAVRQ